MNPWWLRPTAEGASEQPAEPETRAGEAGGEKRGGGRPAAPAPAAKPRARGRGGRSGKSAGGAEKAPAAKAAPSGKAAQSGKSTSSGKAAGKSEPSRKAAQPAEREPSRKSEPSPKPAKAAAAPAEARSRRRPRGRGDDEPAASPDLRFDDDLTSADFAELRRELVSPPERSRPVADELKIAMFCDLENIAIGVRDSAIKKFDINLILERLLEKGKIIVKKAYCDWERYSDYKRPFHEAAIEMIEIPQKHYSGKNSADIKMVVDAMDLCYSKEHLDTFVIVSGDSDFSPLVSKLKENDKTVIGVGVKDASSALLIANCDEFIYYEDIWRDRQSAPTVEAPDKKKSEAFRLMVDAMQALSRENKDVLWGSMIKQTMQRKKPSFNEGYYGYSTFSDLLEDAERNNLIKLKKDQRSGTYIVTGFSGRGGR